MISYFRTIIALGHLVLTCDQAHYAKLINTLLKELAASKGNNLNARTYIQVRNSKFIRVSFKIIRVEFL